MMAMSTPDKTASDVIEVDLTTLSGWANVTSGSHTLTIVAKADGYLDSPASAEVTFEKAAQVTEPDITSTVSAFNISLKLNDRNSVNLQSTS